MIAASAQAAGSHSVSGYVKRDGTYVAPHYQTNRDSSRTNNYSAQGNYNPYTGHSGSVDPYAPREPSNPYAPKSNPYDPN